MVSDDSPPPASDFAQTVVASGTLLTPDLPTIFEGGDWLTRAEGGLTSAPQPSSAAGPAPRHLKEASGLAARLPRRGGVGGNAHSRVRELARQKGPGRAEARAAVAIL